MGTNSACTYPGHFDNTPFPKPFALRHFNNTTDRTMSSSIGDSTLLALSASPRLTENCKALLKAVDDAELKSMINHCIRNLASRQAYEEALCVLSDQAVKTQGPQGGALSYICHPQNRSADRYCQGATLRKSATQASKLLRPKGQLCCYRLTTLFQQNRPACPRLQHRSPQRSAILTQIRLEMSSRLYRQRD